MQTWTDNDKPLLYVLDTKFNFVQLEEHYSSLVWTERYQESGDFVLDIPLNKANYSAYKKGYYVRFTDSDETMIVETVEIQHDIEEPQLEVSGRSLTSILERRINASKVLDLNLGKIEYIGNLGHVVSSIVSDEIVDPYEEYYQMYHLEKEEETGDYIEVPGRGKDTETSYLKRERSSTPERKIPNFKYTNKVSNAQINKQFDEIKTVYDLLNIFAKKTVTGFKILLDGHDFNLITYQGTDRTTKQQVVNPIIFSTMLDNVSYVKYFEDHTDYKNVILSYTYDDKEKITSPVDETLVVGEAGEDEVGETPYFWFANEDDKNSSLQVTGLDRYELAVKSNASVTKLEEDSTTGSTGGEYPGGSFGKNPDYDVPSGDEGEEEEELSLYEKLKISADEEFDSGDHDVVRTTEGSVDPLVRYQFNVNYFLGDTIEFFDDIGIHVIALIDEVVRSYDQEGYIITPNFKTMDDYDYGDEGDPEEDPEYDNEY